MEISRRGPGEACLVLEGRDILDLVQAEATDAEYDQVLTRLEGLLQPPGALPRVVVQYREGLFASVQSDNPLEAVLIEDDPHDEPVLVLHRHRVAADSAAVDAALSAAERRLRLNARASQR
jgi:hypothetical protein